MPLFKSFVQISRDFTTSKTFSMKKYSTRLVDALVDGEPKGAILSPSENHWMIGRVQQVAQELLDDTRQQYQQTLAVQQNHDVSVEQAAEVAQRRDLMVALSGFALATAGATLAPIFYWPSIAFILYSIQTMAKETYHEFMRERRLNYRVVCTLTIPIALLGGFIWPAALGVLAGRVNFYLVAKTENRSKKRIADLFGSQIRTVWMLVDGIEVETAIEKVQTGDIVVVQAGQMVPVDGVITDGMATIDQHMLTGEAQPVEKEHHDTVLASTVVLAGRIYVEVQEAGGTTVASQITTMLNQTNDFQQSIKSRTERMLNQMVLPVLGLSLAALPLAGISGTVAILWSYPGFRMILYGPLSMLSYLQVAAQRGILVKDGRALETVHEVDTVVFDKTGTLTLEQPTVSHIFCCNGYTESELLRYASAAEAKQSHPIARAILQAAIDQKLDIPTLQEAQYKVGYGLKVQVEERIIWVGSIRFMEMEEIKIPPEIAIQQAESQAQGHSLVLVALDHEIAGAIELQPTIRPEANEIIQDMHKRGIKVVIISGDNEAPTQQLAAELGIDHYFAEVLPEDKAQLVKQLQDGGKKVCFIGDGINDSIALKTADVSISLRGATTIATDMAQIVFMDGTLGQLSTLFSLADEFADNMHLNFLAAVIPGIVSIAGTLLFGWGVAATVLLSQGSMPVGIYNALKPLLDERKNQTI